ncbi:sodium channel modifier 1 isoform X1 [Larus michahellis]|uniref:sodium channel modifier 1 isoform X1 n=1 Tax=Larus michahellis TaxID=119627 RepID=UPI003D9B9F01
MSFKREGDDPGQLGVLQKRRVADLLANYIPEDEALLLRSGRYACTVCAHRPVFDTLDVLTVHRAGKKHMSSKWGTGGGGGLHRVSASPSPLRSLPGLQRFYGRKRSLQDAAQKRQHEQEVQAEEAGVQGSPAPLLAQTRRIARSALLKAAPYSSCCRRTGVQGSSSQSGVTQRGPSVAPTPPELSRKDREAVDASPAALLPGHCGGRADAPKAAPARTQRGGKGKAASSALSRPEVLSPERRQALERYLQLRSAGWIQDRSGKWVKDENAEFDSDEDEPPTLLPA